MKKDRAYWLFVSLAFVFTGCANVQGILGEEKIIAPIENHREVLEPEFQFLGKAVPSVRADLTGTSRDVQILGESLVYARPDSGNVVQRALIVRTYEVRGGAHDLLPGLDFDDRQVLGSGSSRIGSKDLPHVLLTAQGCIEKDEMDLFREKGLLLSDGYLLKAYSERKTGLLEKTMVHILYFERLDEQNAGLAHGQPSRTGSPLSDETDRSLTTFHQKADDCVNTLMGASGGKKDPEMHSVGEVKAPNMVDEQEAETPFIDEKKIQEPVDESDGLERKLTELKNLLDKGLITQDDYDKAKAKLLENFTGK